ncbi:hypothetical protein PV327_007342 [Microctonus hyperodae]|uniref:Exonuclease domain-containing protein n=1 Tax=Microctonus hyperodae TaxID=165561 RepID=A0AA39KYL4_MICHY|nr:hypothetical protein PV327_007342 [Microctonus hyperodae]
MLQFLTNIGKPCILIGHNIKTFDISRLIYNLVKLNLIQDFAKVIIGSIDTLFLIKKKFPERKGKGALKLTVLVKDLLNQPFDNAHDAYADVCALESLIHKYFEPNYLMKFVYRFKDSICDFKNSLSSKENEESLKPLQNVVSNYTINKLANAGISILQLREKYEANGKKGLEDDFGNMCATKFGQKKRKSNFLKCDQLQLLFNYFEKHAS